MANYLNADQRESAQHYIPASDTELDEMMKAIGLSKMNDLYQHLPQELLMEEEDLKIPTAMSHDKIRSQVGEMADLNLKASSFLGDGLQDFSEPAVAADVCSIRELTTSYTPYQPERSQGTLNAHWIFQCLLAQITGFEAINASMYDRATTLFESIKCSLNIQKKRSLVVISESIFPGDLEVIQTMVKHTSLSIKICPLSQDGVTDLVALRDILEANRDEVASVVIPQSSHFGLLEPVDELVDLVHSYGALAIAVIDPMQLATGGLKPPAKWGNQGADLLVGEGQHLALRPNFGGPGLGIFGIRYNESTARTIRSTAGRFVGQAKDKEGRSCRVIVLSTREQHIKREKANSNICSNEAFIATLAGASLLSRGEEGFKSMSQRSKVAAHGLFGKLTQIPGLSPAFSGSFYNSFTLQSESDVSELIAAGEQEGLLIGVDVSDRASGRQLLQITCSDRQSDDDLMKLENFFISQFGESKGAQLIEVEIPTNLSREGELGLLKIEPSEVISYYRDLGQQNATPDTGLYPLGSCTMKYNPMINDEMAGLDGFQNAHPQAPESATQGCLKLLHEIQEWFKAITGLPGVTTQPVAGAQGELVGLKMFQAYHTANGDEKRDIVLIPRSAHGTNPATATYAGFETLRGKVSGIVTIEADEYGQVNMDQLRSVTSEYGERICGIMVTNPNTAGLFETEFKEMADLVHGVGGLVYMDGANMNAIAGWVNLDRMGVDAVHNNLHKTWSIPHGGGGPGDAIVAVSEKLVDFLPGIQVIEDSGKYRSVLPPKSMGSIHRHLGNFAHKVRCYTYLLALGRDGIRRMSAVACLSARYLHHRLAPHFPTLPGNTRHPVMHEFILTLSPELFDKIQKGGVPKAQVISSFGKLFLDFGFHAPTVSFPEVYGIMVEPTESFTLAELNRFADAVIAMKDLVEREPTVLVSAPHFTPVGRIDEVSANKSPILSDKLTSLPEVITDRVPLKQLQDMKFSEISEKVLETTSQPVGAGS